MMQTAIASTPSQYWTWNDQTIHYVRAGNSRSPYPPLLLVHGFGASTDHWRKNIEGLGAEFDVWAIDLLGFGRSAKPNQDYSGDLWREQLRDFIAEVIGQPVILAGNSLGGYASLCLAAHHPDLANGLVLLNSAGPFSDSVPSSPSNSLTNLWGRLVRNILLQPLPSWLLFQYVRRRSTIRKTLEKVYLDTSAVTDQLVEDIYRPSADPGAAQVFAAVFKSPRGDYVDTLLQRRQCPLLMLWGEADPWMNARDRAVKFRQHVPDLTEYFLEAGHCPHDEVPDQVNTLIREWVQSWGRV